MGEWGVVFRNVRFAFGVLGGCVVIFVVNG